MPACKTLTAYQRQCGRNARAGINPDVYAIAYDDLILVTGSTEKYTESVTGLVTAIGMNTVAPLVKFVKIGTVVNQGALTEAFTANENGTFDIVKTLAVAINNIGTIEGRNLADSFIGQPVAFLVKLNSGAWVALGLNGQFQMSTTEGGADGTSNGRTITFSGSDSVFVQIVDPTIVAGYLAA